MRKITVIRFEVFPNVSDDTEWQNSITGARCAYNNDEDYV